MTHIEEALAVAIEYMASRQRSTSQSSYHSGRMLARELGREIRRGKQEKAIALAIIAAEWLALPAAGR